MLLGASHNTIRPPCWAPAYHTPSTPAHRTPTLSISQLSTSRSRPSTAGKYSALSAARNSRGSAPCLRPATAGLRTPVRPRSARPHSAALSRTDTGSSSLHAKSDLTELLTLSNFLPTAAGSPRARGMLQRPPSHDKLLTSRRQELVEMGLSEAQQLHRRRAHCLPRSATPYRSIRITRFAGLRAPCGVRWRAP